MNGRCENNALDAAFDVCDACGGEYCQPCLLFPNGLKKVPLCKTCAIANSGVRKRAKRQRMQSRGAAGKRRKELRKRADEEQQNKAVTVTDLPDFDFGPPVAVVEDKPKKKRLRRKGDPGAGTSEEQSVEPSHDDAFEQDLDPVLEYAHTEPASRVLDEIRATGGAELATSGEADLWNFPTNFDKNPQEPQEAVELAEPPEQIAANWEPLHDPDSSNPFDDPSAGRLRPEPRQYETTAFPAPDTDTGPLHEYATERRGEPTEVPPPAHRNAARIPIEYMPESVPEQYPPPPQADDLGVGPAPLVQPEPEDTRKKKKRSLIPTRAKEPVVVPETAAQARVQDPTTDTDAAGQWIPPNLRGMIAHESQTELPKRRRDGS